MYICENCFKEYDEGYDICPHCGYVRGSGKREVYMLRIGVTLRNGRYIIGKILGNGGFGITYKAWDTVLNRYVAIKEFYPSGIVNRVPGTNMSCCMRLRGKRNIMRRSSDSGMRR